MSLQDSYNTYLRGTTTIPATAIACPVTLLVEENGQRRDVTDDPAFQHTLALTQRALDGILDVLGFLVRTEPAKNIRLAKVDQQELRMLQRKPLTVVFKKLDDGKDVTWTSSSFKVSACLWLRYIPLSASSAQRMRSFQEFLYVVTICHERMNALTKAAFLGVKTPKVNGFEVDPNGGGSNAGLAFEIKLLDFVAEVVWLKTEVEKDDRFWRMQEVVAPYICCKRRKLLDATILSNMTASFLNTHAWTPSRHDLSVYTKTQEQACYRGYLEEEDEDESDDEIVATRPVSRLLPAPMEGPSKRPGKPPELDSAEFARLLRESYEARTNKPFSSDERKHYYLRGIDDAPTEVRARWSSHEIRTAEDLAGAVSKKVLRKWLNKLRKDGWKEPHAAGHEGAPYWVDKADSQTPSSPRKAPTKLETDSLPRAGPSRNPSAPQSSSMLGKRGREPAVMAPPPSKRPRTNDTKLKTTPKSQSAQTQLFGSPIPTSAQPSQSRESSTPPSTSATLVEDLTSDAGAPPAGANQDYFLSPDFPGVRFPRSPPDLAFAISEADRLQTATEVSEEFKYSHLGHLLLQMSVADNVLTGEPLLGVLRTIVGAAGLSGPDSLTADTYLVTFLAKELDHPGSEDLFRYLSVVFATAASYAKQVSRRRRQSAGTGGAAADSGASAGLEEDLKELEEDLRALTSVGSKENLMGKGKEKADSRDGHGNEKRHSKSKLRERRRESSGTAGSGLEVEYELEMPQGKGKGKAREKEVRRKREDRNDTKSKKSPSLVDLPLEDDWEELPADVALSPHGGSSSKGAERNVRLRGFGRSRSLLRWGSTKSKIKRRPHGIRT
ncbi:hypothetical protein HMN09_00265600 [Mycena chlorophos]|uniref:Uncharacterized protein n=1 Tax=Mycena chlorophos TaxID=658473 RepID=A0A8H6TL68_MYCCL|nr:hypothetical protein HMN09_00265600 [Mycena chlorophos]